MRRMSRGRISHHVFDTISELGHFLTLRALICKYTLAGIKEARSHLILMYERIKQQVN